MTRQEGIKEVEEVLGEQVIASTLTEEEALLEFDDAYGYPQGAPFTAWTENYVLFPVCYDAEEWIGYVPRNPCERRTKHQGGGL